jgi:hypothetical protein
MTIPYHWVGGVGDTWELRFDFRPILREKVRHFLCTFTEIGFSSGCFSPNYLDGFVP